MLSKKKKLVFGQQEKTVHRILQEPLPTIDKQYRGISGREHRGKRKSQAGGEKRGKALRTVLTGDDKT